MKGLSIIHNTLPGGVQRVGALETSELSRMGYDMTLISLVKTQEWGLFKMLDISPVYLSRNEIIGRLFSGLWINKFSKNSFDFIIAHNNTGCQVASKIKQKNKDIKMIFYLHDPLAYPIAGSICSVIFRLLPKILQKMESKHIETSDIVFVNSKVSLNKLLSNHKENFDKIYNKITILYPTLNVPLKKQQLTQNKQNYLLIVGRIDHEAFYNLAKIIQLIDIPLVIAGYGHPYNPNFRKILNIFKLLQHKGKDITFVFSPSDEELLNLYKNASLFVYPGHENFNMSALEAMSAGCPILVADTSGVCELLPPNLREYLCLPKKDVDIWTDRIKEIVHGDNSHSLGTALWRITQRYNLNTHIQNLVKVLEGLL